MNGTLGAVLLSQGRQDEGSGIGGMLFGLIYLAILIVAIAGLWKSFEKAGKPGWAAIIPFYNIYVMLEIAGKPAWWLIMIFLIPCADIVFLIMLFVAFAKSYGKGGGFGIGLILLGFIFFPILGFGDAKYIGPQP